MNISSKSYSDPARWICLYPIYLNSMKTQAEGRRIPKHKAVENPTSQEIFDIVQHAGLECELEKGKFHPREGLRDPAMQGRVRVHLRNDDGSPVKATFPTRGALLLYLGEMIPKLKGRQHGGEGNAQQSAGAPEKGNQSNKQKKKK